MIGLLVLHIPRCICQTPREKGGGAFVEIQVFLIGRLREFFFENSMNHGNPAPT